MIPIVFLSLFALMTAGRLLSHVNEGPLTSICCSLRTGSEEINAPTSQGSDSQTYPKNDVQRGLFVSAFSLNMNILALREATLCKSIKKLNFKSMVWNWIWYFETELFVLKLFLKLLGHSTLYIPKIQKQDTVCQHKYDLKPLEFSEMWAQVPWIGLKNLIWMVQTGIEYWIPES